MRLRTRTSTSSWQSARRLLSIVSLLLICRTLAPVMAPNESKRPEDRAFAKRPASQLRSQRHVASFNTIRDQLSLSSWLLLAAAVQCLVFALPLRKAYLAAPTLALAGYRLLTFISTVLTYNGTDDGRVLSKPMIPVIDTGKDKTGGVCVLMLGVKTYQWASNVVELDGAEKVLYKVPWASSPPE